MIEEEVVAVCEYMRTHKPGNSVFDTISNAIYAVTGDRVAAMYQDFLSYDDRALIPRDELGKLAGVKTVNSNAGVQGINPDVVARLEEAATYAMSRAGDLNTKFEDEKDELKRMRNDILETQKDSYNYNNFNYEEKYNNDISKIR